MAVIHSLGVSLDTAGVPAGRRRRMPLFCPSFKHAHRGSNGQGLGRSTTFVPAVAVVVVWAVTGPIFNTATPSSW